MVDGSISRVNACTVTLSSNLEVTGHRRCGERGAFVANYLHTHTHMRQSEVDSLINLRYVAGIANE